MNKIAKIVLAAMLLLSIGATTANADVKKGQKLFLKKLKSGCGIAGNVMAHKHTMAEWKKYNNDGKMADAIKEICPKVKDKALKEKYLPHYFDFFHEYAVDSGNVPSC
ncbi:cytochrome C [Sulfurimonas sp.]